MNYDEIHSFLTIYEQETKQSKGYADARLAEIKAKGDYWQTTDELTHAARVAWRNSNKCIGRLFWQSLHVFDERKTLTHDTIFERLVHHINFATNGGKIRPTITVFHPERVRIWNEQLVRYAGYDTADGIIGDPASVAFTKTCIDLGWQPKYGRFDVLPLVIQVNGTLPRLYDVPPACVLEVPMTHPTNEQFANLGLRWYAVPMISNMKLDGAGIEYPAAPFNGWYMGTEIGARNFADVDRYNQLPAVAKLFGLDTSTQTTLWQDRALVELNVAVLHSFKTHGVSIVDHHNAAQQFKLFEQAEEKDGRAVTGNWAWLVPPMAGATTHIYHKPYKNHYFTPNYFYQKKPY